MRAAIYARVSREGQTTDNQLAQLRQWCQTMGHTVVAEFIETESGGKGIDKRKALAAMMESAHKRQFDLVVIWSLDRLSREGMVKTVGYLQGLAAAGVAFHSFTEPALCSDNELVRDIVIAVMSSLARAERARISERTKAGLERVRAQGSRSGRPIGRPAVDPARRERIRRLAASHPDLTPAGIAKLARVDPKTVRKYLG